MADETSFIANMTKGKLHRLPFVEIKNAILGKKYELSVSFVTPKVSRDLNRTYRGKDHPTNVLSFSLTKTSGELILEPKTIAKGAPDFNMDARNFTAFLLIHGMLHLKGMQHGSTMEKAEARYKKKFSVVERKVSK